MKLQSLFILTIAVVLGLSQNSSAQFHTVAIPTPSAKVTETQRLGITDITIDYHSPAAREREIWNDVVGTYENTGLAWRAGANMNTTIDFTTDVIINGNALSKGKYGFHILTNESDTWTLLFAHQNNQWGSYYLDLEEHITLKVDVDVIEAPLFSEQLDYKFIDRSDSTLIIALDWAEKRIPFTVEVDLNKTVLESFRSELLGLNTYRWEAWNDAANWCLERNTNLEEALEWANRSIEGGYGGFAANKNFTNMLTKANIQLALMLESEAEITLDEAKTLAETPMQIYMASDGLMTRNYPTEAINMFSFGTEQFEDVWFLHYGLARSLYKSEMVEDGLEAMSKALEYAPDNRQELLNDLLTRMRNGEEIR